jgi:hypothetical protein
MILTTEAGTEIELAEDSCGCMRHTTASPTN